MRVHKYAYNDIIFFIFLM